ncbi:hypothetical protein QF028_000034 [Neobacillus sp. B4I6]|uniref:hypothetical protein n=1 Tax=Neobacillus sp. B4I6 TaxID=3373925 RepID=UPI003D1B2943
MSINYKFNQYRVSGEATEEGSAMAYRLCSKNVTSEHISGYRVGQFLYLHHIKGMTAQDIKKTPVGYGIATNMIKSILKGFGRQSGTESVEAYEIALYMIECEPRLKMRMYLL